MRARRWSIRSSGTRTSRSTSGNRRDRYALGNYRHEPILFEPDDLRPYREGEPQPSIEPFTPEHFEVAYGESIRLLPAVKDRVDETTAINGMFSFTPDMGSIVGESADVRGFWICEAVWVTHGGGMGRMAAEWIAGGEPSMDMAEADANRFYPFMTTPPYVGRAARSSTARSTTSSIRSSR